MTGIEELGLAAALAGGGAAAGGAGAGAATAGGLGLGGTIGALGAAASGGAALYMASQAGKGPRLAPKIEMPDPNDPTAMAAHRRKLEEIAASKGRESTILDDTMPAYSNTALGL